MIGYGVSPRFEGNAAAEERRFERFELNAEESGLSSICICNVVFFREIFDEGGWTVLSGCFSIVI